MAITPRDLLLGASPGGPGIEFDEQARMDEDEHRLAKVVRGVEAKVRLWWARFFDDVFPLLIPRRAMVARQANLEVGDIVLVRYVAKYGRDAFRLARIVRLHPDRHGIVRTVTVWLRNRARAPRESAEECGQGVVELKTPVQRLVLILPAEDQPQEILARLRGQMAGLPADGASSPHTQDTALSPAASPLPRQEGMGDTLPDLEPQPEVGVGPQVEVEPPLPQRLRSRQRARAQGGELALPYNLSPPRPGGRKIGRF